MTKTPEKVEFSITDELVSHHIKQSLQNIDLDYIDLYLMHFLLETHQEDLKVYRVLELFVDQGDIHSIGFSNFNIE